MRIRVSGRPLARTAAASLSASSLLRWTSITTRERVFEKMNELTLANPPSNTSTRNPCEDSTAIPRPLKASHTSPRSRHERGPRPRPKRRLIGAGPGIVSGVVDLFAADEGHSNTGVVHARDGNTVRVLLHGDQVRQHADLDPAHAVGHSLLTSGVEREKIHGLAERDRLGLTE